MIRYAQAAARSLQSMPVILSILLLGIAGPVESIGDDNPHIQRTRLFVLGTPHLSSLKDDFRSELLDGLMDRLLSLQADAILVEALPGPSIMSMELQGGSFDEVLEQYSQRMTVPGRRAQEILELSWAEAYRKISTLDRDCDEGVTLETCILIYLAAYEYDTALLKWSAAPESERKTFRERHADIVERFDKSLQSSNEYYTIANRLARASGRARIHPVDAHQEKGPLLDMMAADPSIEAFITRVFGDYSEHPYLIEMKDREKDDESQFGKTRLALWEQRNLLMAANIARVLAEYPGKTAVYIVGSGHKPFIDAYFKTMNWVEVLRANQVLGITDDDGS